MVDPIGYLPQIAGEAMTLSAIAYVAEDIHIYDAIHHAIQGQLATSSALGGHFKLVWLGLSPDFSNLMYVAQDDRGSDRFAVVIRGTDFNFLGDLKEDFDVLDQHAWPWDRLGASKVAKGSWDGLCTLLAMTSGINSVGTPTLVEFFSQAMDGEDDAQVWVTGHSLGGALATMLGLWLVDNLSAWTSGTSPSLTTYTFASPTTGNQAFADYYNTKSSGNPAWQAFRVFNEQDVVPHAYQSLAQIVYSDIPLSFQIGVEIILAVGAVEKILEDCSVSYVQVGNGVGLSNNPPNAQALPQCGLSSPPMVCANPATTWEDFGCWACYEHTTNTYLILLGVSPLGITEKALKIQALITSGRALAKAGEAKQPS